MLCISLHSPPIYYSTPAISPITPTLPIAPTPHPTHLISHISPTPPTSSVLVAEVREPPEVAHPDRERESAHEEVEPPAPRLPLLLIFLLTSLHPSLLHQSHVSLK